MVIQSSANLQPLRRQDLSRKAAKRLNAQLLKRLDEYEQSFVVSGVNFSRADMNAIMRYYAEGEAVEFETVGPYLANYLASDGVMSIDNLIPEDLIGVRLAALFRKIFPKARLVALCDEYNHTVAYKPADNIRTEPFTKAQKQAFFAGFKRVLEQAGAIPNNAIHGKEYLFVAESDNVAKAERLAALLGESGFTQEVNGALYFVNPAAENPLHRRFCLRTVQGRWLCEALDAAGFLSPDNKNITHLIVLPDYMKAQQDRVWEILRVLGHTPSRHHNLFFDSSQPAEDIVNNVARAF
jgi:hypothetical protein